MGKLGTIPIPKSVQAAAPSHALPPPPGIPSQALPYQGSLPVAPKLSAPPATLVPKSKTSAASAKPAKAGKAGKAGKNGGKAGQRVKSEVDVALATARSAVLTYQPVCAHMATESYKHILMCIDIYAHMSIPIWL